MKLISTIIALSNSIALARAACPALAWALPGPEDERSPCPMLNVLANHGFFPHDGKHLTREIVVEAFASVLNIEESFASTMYDGGLACNTRLPNATDFSLGDLNNHDSILESDGSLSREDFYFNRYQVFNSTVFDESKSYWASSDTIDVRSAAAAHLARVADSRARNPEFNATWTPERADRSWATAALYISMMGDNAAGTAPREWVEYMFEQERFPADWHKPTQQLTLATFTDLKERIVAAGNNSTATEGMKRMMSKRGRFHA
ncbi:Chloroperoxidase [Xylariomycetidae sp. FL2044]|nr:Chloroperoxidase [Xylariomycetidae sp. FL2044]